MISKTLESWGRYPQAMQQGHAIYWQNEVASILANITKSYSHTLAYGCGRSYGDSCLAASKHVLAMSTLQHLLAADWEQGIVVVEAGVTLADLINIILPRGWFLPVTPGTQFVTLGGAVANDVHGKNHHVMGTLGRHIKKIALYRSDEGYIVCSNEERPELFAATIGGLGLTGIILALELKLRPVSSNQLKQCTIRFENIDEYFALSQLHQKNYEYTVAWLDCLASGKQMGRGHYSVANHALEGFLTIKKINSKSIPFEIPFSLVNVTTLKLFNTLYYYRQLIKEKNCYLSYQQFFYPLDGLLQWNRLYGKTGFQQYQCIIPANNSQVVIKELLKEISASRVGSFLAVLKQYGAIKSPGLLSFPLAGTSLALDFPQTAISNNKLFNRLDNLVHEAGGRLYPAKDAHMSSNHFKKAYPAWEKLAMLRDPCLLSDFWKRVTQ